jgi:hypothetical protein
MIGIQEDSVFDDDDLRIKNDKVVTDAAVALTIQTVTAQREVAEELRNKSAIDAERRTELERRPEQKADEKAKKEAPERSGTPPPEEAKEPPRRSKTIVDIDA